MTAPPNRRILAGVVPASQRRHFRVEQFLHVHQTQWDQRANQLHLGLQLQIRVVLAADDLNRTQRATLLAPADRT